MRSIRKILVPTDFSEGAEAAIAQAVDLAGSFDGTITLLHVYQAPDRLFPYGGEALTGPEQVAEEAAAELGRAQARLAAAGVRATCRSVEGMPADQIVRVAATEGFDLIVMGTHGRTGLGHLVLGSVAETVVRTTPCPVLTVRIGAAAAVSAG